MACNVDSNVFECVFTIARALQVTVQGCQTPKASFCTPPSNNWYKIEFFRRYLATRQMYFSTCGLWCSTKLWWWFGV